MEFLRINWKSMEDLYEECKRDLKKLEDKIICSSLGRCNMVNMYQVSINLFMKLMWFQENATRSFLS